MHGQRLERVEEGEEEESALQSIAHKIAEAGIIFFPFLTENKGERRSKKNVV
jgi:hypothetical protein